MKFTARDEYRVILFKKKLRNLIGAPWLRFYSSIGRCHICIMANDFKVQDFPQVMTLLKREGIDFKKQLWWDEEKVYSLNIPIDQEALPERADLKKLRARK